VKKTKDSLANKIKQELLALKFENVDREDASILLEQKLLLEIFLGRIEN